MTATRLRLVAAMVAGLAWAVTLPLAADALRAERDWTPPDSPGSGLPARLRGRHAT